MDDLVSLRDFRQLEPFSVCLFTRQDRSRNLVKIATQALQSFFLLPSSQQCESLSKIHLRIEGEALASRLVNPIFKFDLSDSGERLRYHRMAELYLEVTYRRSTVPHLDGSAQKAVFGRGEL